MVADRAVLNLPDPAVRDGRNRHAQVRLAWNRLVDVNSHELVTNLLLSCEFSQASAMDLMNTNKHPSLKTHSSAHHQNIYCYCQKRLLLRPLEGCKVSKFTHSA